MNYDVLIAGAGPSGIAAALEAARSGAKTAVVERYGCVGGNLTQGYVGPIMGDICKGTISEEIEDAICLQRGICPDFEKAKIVLIQKLHEAGVDVYLQIFVSGVVKDGDKIDHIQTFGKFGPGEFAAKIFMRIMKQSLSRYSRPKQRKLIRRFPHIHIRQHRIAHL